jgi:hypothetical protein
MYRKLHRNAAGTAWQGDDRILRHHAAARQGLRRRIVLRGEHADGHFRIDQDAASLHPGGAVSATGWGRQRSAAVHRSRRVGHGGVAVHLGITGAVR